MNSPETQRLFRNTLAQSGPIVTSTVFSFLLAPLMLSRLGLAQFGVWAVTGALAQYGRLLDLGISNSLARFVAMYEAQHDRRAIVEAIGVGIGAALFVGGVMVAAAVLAAPLVADVLGVLSVAEMRVVLVSAVAISVLNLFGAVLAALPIGLREMVPPGLAATAGNVVNFVASVIALLFSTALTTYALANAAAAAAGLLLTLGAVLYVWRAPLVRRPSLTRVRSILSFGIKSQTITLAQLVNVQTDKIIIAAMLGPRTAGAYEIGNRVVQGVVSLSLLTLSAMIPTATADLVKRGKQVISEYYQRYSLRSLAIALPLFGTISISAPYLLLAWLGEIPPDSPQVIVLLSLSFAISLATGVPMTLIMSDGHPGVVAQTAILVVVLNICGTLAAAPLFGLWGVLGATVAAEAIASAIFLVRFHRRYSLPPGLFGRGVGPPASIVLAASVPFGLWYLLGGGLPDARGPAVLGLFATAGVFGLACWIVESRMRLLPEKLRLDWLLGRLRARGGEVGI